MHGRFLRNQSLRDALWLAAGGKCQMCGQELPKDWHADHIEPYCQTGRTNVHEMQALCPACNLSKGAAPSMTALAADFHYSLNAHPGTRPGILKAEILYLEWLRNHPFDDRDFGVVLPTRYGKSDFIRTAALVGQAQHLTGPALVVHPAPFLAEQFLEESRLASWRRRWEIHYRRPVTTLRDFCARPINTDPASGKNEWLASIHIHALLHKEDLLRAFVDHLLSIYRLPPVMFLDETHRYSKQNRWGDVPRCWTASGGLLVADTATGFRHDGDDLVGFRRVHNSTEEYTHTYTKRHPDPGKLYLVSELGEKHTYDIKADFEVDYTQAWHEKAISKSTVDWIDVELRELSSPSGCDPEDLSLKLSEVPPSKLGRYLSTICRDPKVIADFAARIVKHLRTFRSHDNTAEATFIVYGLNDIPGQPDNAHLALLQRSVEQAWQAAAARSATPMGVLKTAIASLKADDVAASVNDKSAQIIKRFTDPSAKHLDGLFLKQMGSEGLDTNRICVVGTLDTVRSAVVKIQQWNRGGNVWGSCRHFVIVSLADKLSTEIYEQHVESQGGTATEKEIIESHQEEIDKKESSEPSLFRVVRSIQSGADDSDGDNCTAPDYCLALRFLSEIPQLIHDHTFPQIAAKAKRLGIQPWEDPDPDSVPENTGDAAAQVVAQLNEIVKGGAVGLFRLTHGRTPDFGQQADRDEYGSRFKPEFIRHVKARANVVGTWNQSDPDRIRDVDTLRSLLNVAEQMVREIFSEIS